MDVGELSKCYNFLSQNVFLTDIAPTQMGVVDDDRIFIVYENTGRIELYKVNDLQKQSPPPTVDNNGDERSVLQQQGEEEKEEGKDKGDDEQEDNGAEREPSYELELIIPLFDIDIVQVLHCSIHDGYFVFSTTNRINKSQSVRVYSNWKSTVDLDQSSVSTTRRSLSSSSTGSYEECFSVRLSGELYSLVNNDPAESVKLFNKISRCLNVVELTNGRPAADWSVQFVSRCKLTGTLVLTLRNSKVLLYRYVRCISSNNIHNYAIDFVHCHTVALLEASWIPEVAKLSSNYLAVMSRSHFSMLRLKFGADSVAREECQDDVEQAGKNLEHNRQPLIVKFSSLASHNTKRQPDDYPLREKVEIVFDSLFQSPASKEEEEQKCHSDIVYGPISDALTCKFALFSHRPYSTDGDITEEFDLLLCRRLKEIAKSPRKAKKDPNVQIDLLELGALKERSRSLLGGEFMKSFHFGFDLAPIRDQKSQLVIAHCLYILHGFELDCYLVDLRRDSLKLVPISHLTLEDKAPTFGSFISTPVIRDICFCPQQDLIHILTCQSLETYCTHFYDFLATAVRQNLNRTRSINTSPLMLSCNRFMHQIALLASEKFLFLISNEGEANRHTIYGLRRPDLVGLQVDTDDIIQELKSIQEGSSPSKVKDTVKQLSKFIASNCKFALRHAELSTFEQDKLTAIADKTDKQ